MGRSDPAAGAEKTEASMKPIEKRCYDLIQEVTLRQQPRCRICSVPSEVGHHLFKRDRMATAFLPEAVWGLCNNCHTQAHAHPMLFKAVAHQTMGQRYYDLLLLSHTTCRPDLKKIKNDLLTLLAEHV